MFGDGDLFTGFDPIEKSAQLVLQFAYAYVQSNGRCSCTHEAIVATPAAMWQRVFGMARYRMIFGPRMFIRQAAGITADGSNSKLTLYPSRVTSQPRRPTREM